MRILLLHLAMAPFRLEPRLVLGSGTDAHNERHTRAPRLRRRTRKHAGGDRRNADQRMLQVRQQALRHPPVVSAGEKTGAGATCIFCYLHEAMGKHYCGT